jgi:hypothetical protein
MQTAKEASVFSERLNCHHRDDVRYQNQSTGQSSSNLSLSSPYLNGLCISLVPTPIPMEGPVRAR